MISSALTDIGMRRSSNQDTFIRKAFSEKTYLTVVCDGMGGVKGGKEASKIASEKFVSVIEKFLKDYIGVKDKVLHSREVREVMMEAVEKANTAVHQYSKIYSSLRGMGTTLVAALVIKNMVFCVNVGDSRMYFIKGNKIRQVTKDHSYVQYLVDHGKITQEEALSFPNKNIITKAVGTESHVEADFFKESVSDGTFVLLCSDGLTNFVSDEEIKNILIENDSDNIDEIQLSVAVKKLIDTANENGGADNITASVVRV